MPELEKVTINMSPVDLGKIDLLVGEGSYSNRTDFIRMAVRNQLEKHNIEIQQSVTRNAWMIGAMSIGNGDLAKYAQGAKRVNLNVVGYLKLAKDLDLALATQVLGTIKVRGVLDITPEQRKALAAHFDN
mgnify:CR=1 FL=1